MTNQRLACVWQQIMGKARNRWGKLTEDELLQLEGHAEQVAGKLQERYGLAHDQAPRQAREFRERMNWVRRPTKEEKL